MRLSEVNLDGGDEIVHCEVDNFENAADSGAAHLGMAKAGTEEDVIRKLHHAGSLDARGIMPDLQAAEEEKKE